MKRLLGASILMAVTVIAAPSWLLAAGAQPATKVFRIGYLGLEPSSSPYLDAFRDGLRRLGYVEGQNIILESRFAEGRGDRLPALASELVALKVDVIVGRTATVARTAKNASATIPIVVGVSG